jgi:hypothetical protein
LRNLLGALLRPGPEEAEAAGGRHQRNRQRAAPIGVAVHATYCTARLVAARSGWRHSVGGGERSAGAADARRRVCRGEKRGGLGLGRDGTRQEAGNSTLARVLGWAGLGRAEFFLLTVGEPTRFLEFVWFKNENATA